LQAWAEVAGRIERQLSERVSQGRIPCFDYALLRHGQVVAAGCGGWASVEDRLQLRSDSLFRIFSMTKPITSVVALMLVEEGVVALDEPIARVLPELGELRVLDGFAADGSLLTRPPVNPITLRHLLTHTAGFTYHFMTVPGPDGREQEGPIQRLYRARGIKPAAAKIAALPGDAAPVRTGTELLEAIASIPLVADPGTQFHYSIATDVVGLVIERLTGTSLGNALCRRLFEPLGMEDTGFSVPPAEVSRFTSNYRPGAQAPELVDAWRASNYLRQPSFESGGGGLVSTTADYVRFYEMLRRQGVSDGHRFLSAKMYAQLCRAQLSPQALAGSSLEVSAGTGFGLGLGIYQDRSAANTTVPSGSLFWNGAAGTCCWIDPHHDITAVVMTQLLENDAHRLDRLLHAEIYDADGRLRAAGLDQ
jgi:CubicO group peptidase (beta-lactamase class C family)